MLGRLKSILQKTSQFRRGQNLSWPQVIMHVFRWYFGEKLSLDESLASGAFLLKHSTDHEERAYPRKTMEDFLRASNRQAPELIADKAIFSQFVKGTDILAPETHAIFDPGEKAGEEFGITGSLDFVFAKSEWLDLFANQLPDRFIIKPADGRGGGEIDIFQRQGQGHFVTKGKTYSAEQLYQRIARKKFYGKCVIQEVAKNHPEIEKFTGATALQCLRILTVRSKNEGIKVFSCEFKIAGSADQETDNFKAGITGNILCKVDIETGEIYSAVSLDLDKVEYYEIGQIPLTQQATIGFTIPMFKEAIEATLLAHRCVWGQRFVGWDVAITDKGPMVIEGNWLWGGSSLTTPWFNYKDYEIITRMAG